MSKFRVTFTVVVPLPSIESILNPAIQYWVDNYQSDTSTLTKALILGTVVGQIKSGSPLLGAYALSAVKGQGAHHQSFTTTKVSIPASATTYGGEMIVKAIYDSDNNSIIEINGHTQGIFSGTLKKNVNGLKDYLEKVLPELYLQSQTLPNKQNTIKSKKNLGIAEEIEKLSNLHKEGIISDSEFAKAKKRIIDG